MRCEWTVDAFKGEGGGISAGALACGEPRLRKKNVCECVCLFFRLSVWLSFVLFVSYQSVYM